MRDEPEVFRRYDIRGEVPDEIDEQLVYRLGVCLADYWGSGRVIVGRDGRTASPGFYESLIEGLTSGGCDVVKTGLATTDMVAFLAKQEDATGGVQVTASHMPPDFCGIKPLNSEGRILSNDEMSELKDIYRKRPDFSEDQGGRTAELDKAVERYRKGVVQRFDELFDTDLEGLEIVFDPGNAVGSLALPDVLEQLGAEVRVMNEEIDGDFPGRGPEPNEETLEELKSGVSETGADLGIATDGDADRVMFVDEKGDFVPGDYPLALLGSRYVEEEDAIVCSVNTSQMVEEAVEESGGEVIHAPVGAVFTALRCLEEGLVFGGQPNGHLMDTDFVPYDSGTLFGALLPGLVAESGKTVSELGEELPEFHLEKADVEVEDREEKMEKLEEKVRKKYEIITDIDGVKYSTGYAQVLVRPSGSSPLLRVRSEGWTERSAAQGLEEAVELIQNS
ncbi:MAG: hypothetical protein ABEI58_03545 [Candidatus Nanohaloarchaea archaeon]